ncbi:hypothetical protein B0D73_00015 (plasmid) [Campylobacter jejuni]|nr:hypothetical protein B0D73_00015 [Campylobacter jejuni]OOG20472.1 hypothetical protein A0M64_08815 [Campylobacter jejuni]
MPSVSFTQRYFSISFFNSGDILILAIYYFLPLFLFGEFVLSNTKQKEPMIRELFHNFIGSAS